MQESANHTYLHLYSGKFKIVTTVRVREDNSVVVELLKFKVPPEYREQFIQKDAEIWTMAIASFPGFLGKEVWIDPNQPTEVILVIRWATREQWKSIPQVLLEEISKQFAHQMGNISYELLDSSEYRVCNPPS